MTFNEEVLCFERSDFFKVNNNNQHHDEINHRSMIIEGEKEQRARL